VKFEKWCPSGAALARSIHDSTTEAAQFTIGTTRWYLKQALAKTGAHRQSELVRHVITAVGPMTAGAWADGFISALPPNGRCDGASRETTIS
jgi:hypothetical protein